MRVAGAGSEQRGQAIQLGALLLFAILIINLSLFQIFVVPDQNAEIEFKHSEEVRSDMLGTRNAVLDAATGDQSFVEVDLAPAYPSRSLFVNPAEPSGTVRTTAAQSIIITNDTNAAGGGTEIAGDACPGTPETRALEYRAGYNYYDNAPTYRVENTVLFREFPGETLTGSGQQLVTGTTINLLPLQNAFSESGTGTTTVEPVPGGVLTTSVVDPEIQLPTKYSEDVWEETLSGDVPEGEVSVDETTDTLTLSLTGTYQLNCGPIGVNGAPSSGPRSNSLFGGSGGGSGINPAAATDVKLVGTSTDSSAREVEVTLKNKADETKELVRGRIPFYYSGGGQGQEVTQAVLNGNGDDTLVVGEETERVDTVQIPSGDTRTLTFAFDAQLGNDFYVFEATFADGTSGDYYVDVSDSGSTSGLQASASDLSAGSSGSTETQTLTFTPGRDLPSGATVEIDLSDAQQVNPSTQVDYQSASVAVQSGNVQNEQFDQQNPNNAVVVVTAGSGGVPAGNTVELEIASITTGPSGSQNDPYDAVFTRSDGGSQTTTFTVD